MDRFRYPKTSNHDGYQTFALSAKRKLKKFNPGKYYSFQLDKCTDIINMAVTLMLVTL